MSESSKPVFGWRRFWSVLLGFSFALVLVSGVWLFFAPRGRVAHLMDWRFWGLTRQEWAALHICFSVVCVLVAVAHVWFNWRALVSYFKSRTARRLGLRLEWMAALLVTGLVGWGTVVNFAPFSWVISLRHTTREGWTDSAPGRGRALESRPEAESAGQPAVQAPGRGRAGANRGWGRMTLEQACAEWNLDLSRALEQLRNAGVRARAGQTLREIAVQNGFDRPHDVLNLILEQASER